MKFNNLIKIRYVFVIIEDVCKVTSEAIELYQRSETCSKNVREIPRKLVMAVNDKNRRKWRHRSVRISRIFLVDAAQ